MPDETTLTMYIRRPGDTASSYAQETNKVRQKFSPQLSRRIPSSPSENEEQSLPPFAPRRVRKSSVDIGVSDKVEIDSDNIETPPATRKLVGVRASRDTPSDGLSRSLSNNDEKNEEEEMGDGQFNRFSSTRRTRRYRKSTEEDPTRRADVVSPELVADQQVIRPATLQVQSYPVTPQTPQDTESRLKKWQDRLKYRGNEMKVEEEAIGNIIKSGEELQNLGKSSTLPRSLRHRSNISRSDVMEALKQPNMNINSESQHISQDITNEPGLNNTQSFHSLPRSIRHQSNIKQNNVAQAATKFGFQQSLDPRMNTTKNNDKEHGTIGETQIKLGVSLSNGSNSNISKISLADKKSRAPVQHKSEFIPDIKVQALTPSKQRSEHELNDEGFEETQSLLSESPSQGTSSGCNYEGDSTDAQKKKTTTLSRADSSGSGDTSVGINLASRTSSLRLPERRSIVPRSSSLRKTDSQASLSRGSLSKRTEGQCLSKSINKSNVRTSDSRKTTGHVSSMGASETRNNTSDKKSPSSTHRLQSERTPSKSPSSTHRIQLERTPSKLVLSNKPSSLSSPVKKRVERSNSRSSLRSSRSSLNSATSVSTVRNIRPVTGLGNYTNAIKNLTSDLRRSTSIKKPLAPVQLKNKTSVPASRSSSSGSSIGPASHRSTGLSTSFKENRATGVPASRSSSSGSSIGPARRNATSFMRPTASSAAKDSFDSPKVKPLFRQSIK